ncbi:class I SAM-dependent methyltransferase [Neorhizobium petrolearium]|uniref:Class I SAM-dependent methyltransferase n=1 Tax=Neorhizobium petrolearium TaxID=515361 RepID=A0ABY8M3C9_9HYPH|nr:class I SAM-dependent methyltransferase [Neorhizobium petrolearium]MCC2608811.1 class I SAM-dependent methyltransferase [Neorhizobium petrolearium]WGI69063.1 class I SAM-dependent methyltransferase [Neorhizobium petrolearium]
MAQNIYDRPEFFAGYSQLGRSVYGLAGAAEWPDIRTLLPPMKGLRVIDLGCGFGWFARFAAEEGAAAVLGLDLSENMIARGQTENAHPAVTYEIADLEQVELPNAAFDLAYSALAFHYLEDFDRLVLQVHDALLPDGKFVFMIEHPIYMASANPGWQTDGTGKRFWPVDDYSVEGKRTTDWLAKGVVKYHRTLGTTLNALIDNGFAIRRVIEWHPSPDQIAANPDLAEEMDRPMFLIVSAER